MSLAHLFEPPSVPPIRAARMVRLMEDDVDEVELARDRARKPSVVKIKPVLPHKAPKVAKPPKRKRIVSPKGYAKRSERLEKMVSLLSRPMEATKARTLLGGIGRTQFKRDLAKLASTHRVMMIKRGEVFKYHVTPR